MHKPNEKGNGSSALNAPVHANFEITKRCNHFCGHCYNGMREEPVSEEYLPPEHFKKVMQKLCEWGIFSVAISGGEPFLRTDVIKEILPVAEENHLDICINSNLSCLPYSAIDMLRNKSIAVLTSIYSHDAEKHDKMTRQQGSLARTINNIEKLVRDANVSVGVNCVVTTENLQELYEIGRLASSAGASSFSATVMTPCNESMSKKRIKPKDILEMLHCLENVRHEFGIYTDTLQPILPCLYWDTPELQRFRSRSCNAGTNSVNVTPKGEVNICFQFANGFGNILEMEPQQIWHSITESMQEEYLFPECTSCSQANLCRGGCKKEQGYLLQEIKPNPITSTNEESHFIPKKFKLNLAKEVRFRTERDDTYLLFHRQRLAEVSEGALDFVQTMNGRIVDMDYLRDNHSLICEIGHLIKNEIISIGGI